MARNVVFAIMSTAGTLIAVVVVVVMMVVGGDRRALLIGATTDVHHQLEMGIIYDSAETTPYPGDNRERPSAS